ncbi:phage antirepressor KilAC domain-containing protein [Lactococcus lactis]|uniref:Phage antirepressor KilAC domain-containing protein n=1 Tax=Lactococcus lactis TaxID=1358 RepID=A0AAP3YZP3_9LACT|nr:phage antirepressor KilAC domain-containing protein [Lactococcus lactis]MDG4975670.1 phage antirepressor KilAC domain-containing protein [Lactococcus lactis]
MNTTTIRTVGISGTTYYAITDIFKETDFDITDYQIKNIVSKGNVTKQSIGSANKNLLINLAGLKQIVKRSKSEKLPNLKKFVAEINKQPTKSSESDTSLITKDNVKRFNNGIFDLFVEMTGDGTGLFEAESVAKCLGYEKEDATASGRTRKSVRWARINNILKTATTSGAEIKKGDYISFQMVFKLAFKASNKRAEDFTDFLAIEVLPQIMLTGSYSLPNTPQSNITAQEVHLLKLKEKAFDKAVEKIAFENSCYTMTQAAEELGMSVRQFTSLLEDNSLIYKADNAKIMATDPNSKLFYLRKFHESKNSAIVQTKVTPFGLENFRLMFVSDNLNLLDLLEA